jgi:hypothetical protein
MIHDKIILFNWNMENYPRQQCNHKDYMALVLADSLGKLVRDNLFPKGQAGSVTIEYREVLGRTVRDCFLDKRFLLKGKWT